MEAQEIISLIEEYIERLERIWQKASIDEVQAPTLEAKQAADYIREGSNAQVIILHRLLEEINEKKENTHDTEESSTHLPTG